MSDNLKRLIRNLRIKKELKDLCKSKGLNQSLAHRIATEMFFGKNNLEISQKFGIHVSTTKSYRKVLGSLEESKFNQILSLPRLMFIKENIS